MVWIQACTVWRPVAPSHAVAPRSQVRLEAEPPALLASRTVGPMAPPLCSVRRMEGTVERQAGDTLVFARVRRVVAAPTPGPAADQVGQCSRVDGPATMVRTSGLVLSERRISKGRTAALLIGIVAAGVAFAAYGASQIEYDWPNGGGTSY
jgi:hypothetical protein